MQNQSTNIKKTWQEPVLIEINLLGGSLASAGENVFNDTYNAYS